jgi:hypothetical protein
VQGHDEHGLLLRRQLVSGGAPAGGGVGGGQDALALRGAEDLAVELVGSDGCPRARPPWRSTRRGNESPCPTPCC